MAMGLPNGSGLTLIFVLLSSCVLSQTPSVTTKAAVTTTYMATTQAVTTHPVTTPAVTTHPVTTQAVTTHPVTTQAVTTHPVTTPAVTTHPVTTQAVTTHPVTTQAVTTHPVTTQAVTTHPVTTQAVTTHPVTTPAVTTHPVTTQAVTTHPVTTQAVTTHPVTTQAVTTHPVTTPAVTTHPVTTPAVTTHPVTTQAVTTITATTQAATSQIVTTSSGPSPGDYWSSKFDNYFDGADLMNRHSILMASGDSPPAATDIQVYTVPGRHVAPFGVSYYSSNQYLGFVLSGDDDYIGIDIAFDTNVSIQDTSFCDADYFSVVYVEDNPQCSSQGTWVTNGYANHLCGEGGASVHDQNGVFSTTDLSANMIRTYAHDVMIIFRSDYYSERSGFSFTWTTFNDSMTPTCAKGALQARTTTQQGNNGGSQITYDGVDQPPDPIQTFTALSGSITHFNYANSESLTWRLTIPQNTPFEHPTLKIIFNSTFDVEASSTCSYDYVRLLTLKKCINPDDGSVLVQKWSALSPALCGQSDTMHSPSAEIDLADRVWTSTDGNDVDLYFHSDSSVTKGGFSVYWEVVGMESNPCDAQGSESDPNQGGSSPQSSPGCRQLTQTEYNFLTQQYAYGTSGFTVSSPSHWGSFQNWWSIRQSYSGYIGKVSISLLDLGMGTGGSDGCLPGQYLQIGYLDSTSNYCPVATLCGSTVSTGGSYIDQTGAQYWTTQSWQMASDTVIIKWISDSYYTAGLSVEVSFEEVETYPTGHNLKALTATSMQIDIAHDFTISSVPTLFSPSSQLAWILTAPTQYSSNAVFRLRIQSMYTDTSYGSWSGGYMYQECLSSFSTIHVYQFKASSTQWQNDYRLCGQPSNSTPYYDGFGLSHVLNEEHLSDLNSPAFMIVYQQSGYSSTPPVFKATLDIVLPSITAIQNVSTPIFAPIGVSTTIDMSTFQSYFTDCPNCFDPIPTWAVQRLNRSAVPSYMTAAIGKTNTYSLTINPPNNLMPTSFKIRIIATNKFGLSDWIAADVNLIKLDGADATSVMTCVTSELYIPASQTGTPPPLDCQFIPRRANNPVLVDISALQLSVTGSGYIDQAVGSHGLYGNSATFHYIGVQTGGVGKITESTTNATFTITMYKEPDAASTTLTCSPLILQPNQPFNCTIVTKNKQTVSFKSRFGPPGQIAFFNLSVSPSRPFHAGPVTPTIGSAFSQRITSGFAQIGQYAIRARYVNDQNGGWESADSATVNVIGVPDASSRFLCYDSAESPRTSLNLLSGSKSLKCEVTPRHLGSSIPALSSYFRFQTSPARQSAIVFGNFSSTVGLVIPFQINATAIVNTTSIAIDMYVNNVKWTAPAFQLQIVPAPSKTVLTCDNKVLKNRTIACTIAVTKPTLGSAFTITKDSKQGLLTPLLTERGDGLYNQSLKFKFSFLPMDIVSAMVQLSDGFSKFTTYIYAVPTNASTVSCSNNGIVIRGGSLDCTIAPRIMVGSAPKPVYASPGAFTVKSSGGTVAMASDSPGTIAVTKFTINFVASVSGSGGGLIPITTTGPITISVGFPDSPSTPPIKTVITVVDNPTLFSIVTCSQTTNAPALSPVLCSIAPQNSAQVPVFAAASSFSPYVDLDPVSLDNTSLASISDVTPFAGNIVYFTVTPLRAWQTITVRTVLGTIPVTIQTIGQSTSSSWSGTDSSDAQLSVLGRDSSSDTATVPAFLYPVLAKSSIVSMSCSSRFCAVVTSGGALTTFGPYSINDPSSKVYLGRDIGSSMPTSPNLVQGMFFRSVGILGYVVDDESDLSTFALTTSGKLYNWGKDTDYNNIYPPTLETKSSSLKCGTKSASVVAISNSAPVFIFATACEVYTKSVSDMVPVGRPGNALEFQKVTIPLSDLGLGVTTLLATSTYSIMVFGGVSVYSFGDGLSATEMPSSNQDTSAYPIPQSVLKSSKIADIQGNSKIVLLLTTDGRLSSLDLSFKDSPGQWTPVDFTQLALDDSVVVQSISLAPYANGYQSGGVALAGLTNGRILSWDPTNGDPQYVTGGTTLGYSTNFLYSSVYNKFVSGDPATVLLSNSYTDVGCGQSSRQCGSLELALSQFTKDGATILLAPGVYNVTASSGITISANDIRIQSTTKDPNQVSIVCTTKTGSCISATGSFFAMRGITMRGANVNGTGGVISVSGRTYASFTDMKFQDNRANEGGAIYVQSGSATVSINRCTFTRNTANRSGGAMSIAKGAKVQITSSVFSSNSAAQDGGALLITTATVNAISSNFTSNSATGSGGAISLMTTSTFTGTSIQVKKNGAGANGGAMHVVESDANIYSSTITSNTAKAIGGVFNIQFGGLSVVSSTVNKNQAGTLGGVVYCITGRPVKLTSSTLNLNMASSGGGVIFSTFCSTTVTDSQIQFNNAPMGGAALIGAEAISTFTRTVFLGNNATDVLDGGGGAISFRGSTAIAIANCSFVANVAQRRGGALEFQGSKFTFSFQNLDATRNSAPSGGVWYFDLMPPPKSGWISTIGNTAKHGPIWASRAQSLYWEVRLSPSYQPSSDVNFHYPIGVSLRDYYQQIVAVDNSTTVTMAGADGATNIIGKADGILKEGVYIWSNGSVGAARGPNSPSNITVSSFVTDVGLLQTGRLGFVFRECHQGEFIDNHIRCTTCNPGSYSLHNSSSICSLCPRGMYQDGNGQTGCKPCAPGNYSSVPGMSDCTPAAPGFYQPLSQQADALPCWTNTVSNDTLISQLTCYCKKEYIRDDNPDYDPAGAKSAENQPYLCLPCPIGGDCDTISGKSFETVLAKDTYQAEVSGLNRSFIPCLNPDQCVYGLPYGQCKLEAFTGHLCTTCTAGYGRNGEFGCNKCPSPEANRLYLTAAVFVGVFLIAFMVVSAMQASSQPKAVHSILIKIIMSSIQFNSLALSFDYQWPSQISSGLQTQKTMTSVGQSILSVDCFMSTESQTSPFYIQSLLFMLLPVMIAVGPLLVITPFYFYNRLVRHSQHAWTDAKDQYITSVVVGLFVVHPNIVQQSMKLFNCKSLASQPGHLYLVADLRQQCWAPEHTKWAMLVGLPMVIAYVVGIPVAALILLRLNRSQLDTVKMKMRYGFLSQGYEKQSYFWELVVLGRKILLSAIAVFLASSVAIQSLSALTLCVVALVAHTYYHPFENTVLDHVEFLSLLNSFITFMCGQYLFADIGDIGAGFITVIITLSNIAFFGYAARVLVKAILQQQKDAKRAAEQKKLEKAGEGGGSGAGGQGTAKSILVQKATPTSNLFVQDNEGNMVPINATTVPAPMLVNSATPYVIAADQTSGAGLTTTTNTTTPVAHPQ